MVQNVSPTIGAHRRPRLPAHTYGATAQVRGCDSLPEQGRLSQVRCQWGYRHGVGTFEKVILKDERGSGLGRVDASCDRPQFRAPHSSSQATATASTRSWSSVARPLSATSLACRRASAANSLVRTSGTHS